MADAMTCKQAVEKHLNPLFDVVALLDAAAERIEAATPPTSEDEDRADSLHNTLRLVHLAMDRTKAAAEDMFNATDVSGVAHG